MTCPCSRRCAAYGAPPPKLHRRSVLAGALAAVGLAACGDGGAAAEPSLPPRAFPPLRTPGERDAGAPTADAVAPDPDPDAADDAAAPIGDDASAADVAPPDPDVVVGAPEDFALGTATLIASLRLYVVRDAMGLYAISAVCTHAGCTVDFGGTVFDCPCHGSVFGLDGRVLHGPARSALVHYGMHLDPNGQVVVETSTLVGASARLAA